MMSAHPRAKVIGDFDKFSRPEIILAPEIKAHEWALAEEHTYKEEHYIKD
jgi:hypothetical protein